MRLTGFLCLCANLFLWVVCAIAFLPVWLLVASVASVGLETVEGFHLPFVEGYSHGEDFFPGHYVMKFLVVCLFYLFDFYVGGDGVVDESLEVFFCK